MIPETLPWYVARSAGLVSWYLLALSVVWGLLLSSKLLGRIGKRRWLLDLHRFLGGLSVVFVGVHLTGLLADTYVHFGVREVLVPFASSWNPTAVAWGIVGFYVLIAVEITSLLRNHLPRRFWHAVHLGSFGLFVFATVHLLTAGTDAGNVAVRTSVFGAIGIVIFLTCVRIDEARNRQPVRSRRVAVPAAPVEGSRPTVFATTSMPTAPTTATAVREPARSGRSRS